MGTYQQVLQRKHGHFEYHLAIDPYYHYEVMKRFRVDVHIRDDDVINYVHIPPRGDVFATKDEQDENTAVKFSDDRKHCHVTFSPPSRMTSPFGMTAHYVIKYDLKPEVEMFGESLRSADGYFAHFFSAPFIGNSPKMVVFIVDTSGIMSGHRLDLVKNSLLDVISTLNDKDYFNVISFNNQDSKVLFPYTFAESSTKRTAQAIEFVRQLVPIGTRHHMTNEVINQALQLFAPYYTTESVSEYEKLPIDVSNYQKMIIYIGSNSIHTTPGEVNDHLEQLREGNPGEIPVHTIGFGSKPEVDFLRLIASQSDGLHTEIQLGFDATMQMSNFMNEVTSPLLRDVVIDFDDDSGGVVNVTSHLFDVMYDGTEVAVAGKMTQSDDVLRSQIRGRTSDDVIKIDFQLLPPSTPSRANSNVERIWAIIQLRQLLRQFRVIPAGAERQPLESRIVKLAIKYNFVTSLTSMVVVYDGGNINNDDLTDNSDVILEQLPPGRRPLNDETPDIDFTSGIAPGRGGPPTTFTNLTFPQLGALSDAVGFYGDPHFVVPLSGDVKLCFTWNRGGGEAYNILHDASHGITVTAVMTSLKGGDELPVKSEIDDVTQTNEAGDSAVEHVTFVSSISIMFAKNNFSLLIKPTSIHVESETQNIAKLVLPVDQYPFSFVIGDDVTLMLSDVTRAHAKLLVKMREEIAYQVIIHRDLAKHVRTHLDFSILKYVKHDDLHYNYDGIIGQYLNSGNELVESISNEQEGDKTALVNIGGRVSKVHKHSARNPAALETRISCWKPWQHDTEAERQDDRRFHLDSLFSVPKLT